MFSPAVRVDLFGVQCNNNVADSDGCKWSVSALPGWDGPPIRQQSLAPSGKSGRVVASQFADGSLLVPRGLVKAPSQDAAWAAYNRLVASMPGLDGSGDVAVYEPTPKFLTCQLQGPAKIDEPVNGLFEFELNLIAPYPFKRALTATTVTVGAGATVSHTATGNRAAEIEVTTTSSGTVDLTIGGLRLRWGSLPSGSVLTSGRGFTNRPRTVLGPTGANLFGLIVQPMQWPAISPGANSLHQAGTAGLSVRYFPTYA